MQHLIGYEADERKSLPDELFRKRYNTMFRGVWAR